MNLLAPGKASLETVVARFQALSERDDSPIRSIRYQPARPPELVDIPESAHPALRAALQRRNIPKLYTHQAEAFEKAQQGNVVVVTPTASGKTLCYNLPVLDLLLREPGARAIYLYPTKALAEDQLHEFQSAVDEIGGGLRAFTYDGDTPQDARKAIRQRASVVMTNPDMLHSGILPHHTKWAKAFENLRYIVIDELHYYRGVYGSHVANLLRRMRRIWEFYGSAPRFICSSATIANPRELAEALTGQPFAVVERNGAPAGEKYFFFYNPPVVNKALGIRRSYINETRRIALEFIEREQQTLVFANNRLATEILVTYLKDAVGRTPWRAAGPPARLSAPFTDAGQGAPGGSGGPPHEEAVRGYRGGYLPRERREIERKLRDGGIRAVVATNALELGIDIGSLDAVVMAGYPGTIASTWQRAGRAGRRQSASAAVLVASSAPLDQYIVEHPDYFFGRPPEHAHINPDNLEILLGHLKCAAFELPLRDGEKFGSHDTAGPCRFLGDAGFLHQSGGLWHWTSETYPADALSLRSVTSDNFVVVDITGEPEVIAEVDFPSALTTLHEKAIYLHEARQFHVERFDYKERKAYVRKVACDYFTDAIDYTQVAALQEFDRAAVRHAAARCHGDVRVNRQIVGFKKIKFYTLENVGAGKLSMPEQEMHTTSFWLHFPPEFLARFPDLSPDDRQDGLTGLGAVLRTVGSLLLMCDPRDLGVALGEEKNLYLYDNYSGGIGQSAPLYRMADKLLEHAAQLLASCPCEAGCPSCVGPAGEVGERGKEAARRILAELT